MFFRSSLTKPACIPVLLLVPQVLNLSIKSTIIRPLSQDFLEYLDADGVFMPEGADDTPVESTLSDEEDGSGYESDSEDEQHRKFAFPELDEKIRDAVSQYEAVFPKLNFSSPRLGCGVDATSIIANEMRLTRDVYLLLKSSDFVQHDLNPDHVFDGCETKPPTYDLELVLRKWYPVDRSRELRCFVRHEKLLGISQRDPNYYDFWNESNTQSKVLEAVKTFWENNIKESGRRVEAIVRASHLCSASLLIGHIIDFNPYAPRTDSLLFSYEDLHDLLLARGDDYSPQPELRVVDSPSHPVAARNAPTHQHNMIPLEALTMSSGRSMQDFAGALQEEIRKSMQDDSGDD
ncbi:D123-domain-containing protein [Fomitopsis serialis]|uniref:D123-domain-containing protein n=1 Tax=Fomitopsis serialis TaxID=139415 RepID=UPI00200789E9|nr:D123-domain-containing protein [Neoantrodia serialis]KAH9936177.1 D123-domain-containing protein [Neoantrodia serialis]